MFLQLVFVEFNLNVARVASVGKPEKCATANTVASNSYVDEQTIKETSFPTQPKGIFILCAPSFYIFICQISNSTEN